MGKILDSDWSKSNLLRSDWLQPSVAPYTTPVVKFLSNLTLVYPPISMASTSSKLLTASFSGFENVVLQ